MGGRGHAVTRTGADADIMRPVNKRWVSPHVGGEGGGGSPFRSQLLSPSLPVAGVNPPTHTADPLK